MKIIGKTEKGFIVDIGEHELARLAGYYYMHGEAYTLLVVGAEIDINAMYKQLYNVRRIKGAVETIKQSVAVLTAAISTKLPILEPIVAEIEKNVPKGE